MQSSLHSIESVAPNLFLLRLKVPESFAFKAGQFVILQVPPESGSPEGAKAPRGYFSIASSEGDRGFIELLVERREGHVSQWISNRKVGESLELEGPLGKFGLEEPHSERQVFIGYRAGLAPLRSMILSLLERPNAPLIDLFLLGKISDELLFDFDWERLEEKHQRFHYHPLLPDSPHHGNPAQLLAQQLSGRSGLAIYVAGFKAEIEPIVRGLEQEGFPKEILRVESFG
jgi:NAD(P)H-flavin reductase